MLCDHLEGWDGEGGREGNAGGRGYGDVCTCIAGSLWCGAEADTPLWGSCTPMGMFREKKMDQLNSMKPCEYNVKKYNYES